MIIPLRVTTITKDSTPNNQICYAMGMCVAGGRWAWIISLTRKSHFESITDLQILQGRAGDIEIQTKNYTTINHNIRIY